MPALLDPTNDYVFKRLFAEAPDLLVALINDLRPDLPDITAVEVLNPNIEPSELTGKYIILDVLARDADGHCYNVEVQVRRYGVWHKRGLFYLARTLGGQLSAGEDYQELRASVGLHLLDFDLFAATDSQRQQALWRFEMRDESQPQVSLGNILQMNLVELKKADRLGLPPGPLRAWITFFKHWQEELTMATVAHEPVKQAMNRIRQLSADEEARRLAFVRERALHDEVSFLNEAKREGVQEGMEKGMEKGIEKGRLEEARDALRVQLNIKFGELPSWVEEQIGTADHQRLRAWMGDLLFADSLDGLFRH
jgi:predicted transposase/invertase (TIGR01784 family)